MDRNKTIGMILLGALAIGLIARQAPIALAEVSLAPQTASPVHFTAGGNAAEIPATFIENLVFLPVHVNDGKPSLFEIDTTAQVSSIDPARAAEISLHPEASATGQIVRDPLIALPGVDVPLASIALFAPKDFGAMVGRQYEGTLGSDFLNRVVVEIDYGRETVRLFDPSSYHSDARGIVLPLTFVAGMPVIRAKFTEPKGRSLEADFIVNTALNESIVFSNRYADAHHLFSSRMSTASASDPQLDEGASVALARMKTFQIGRFTIEDPLAAFPQSDAVSAGNPQIAGSIGGGMLRRYAVVFDFSHQQIIFTPASRFRLYDQEDKSGLTLVAKGADLKRFEVAQVQPGSPAAEAGIQKGDVIAGVDNEPGADMTLASVRDLFRQIPHKYKLLIERNDKTFEVTLQMRHRI
jgi:PDZ domain